jgi:hypothetical protein
MKRELGARNGSIVIFVNLIKPVNIASGCIAAYMLILQFSYLTPAESTGSPPLTKTACCTQAYKHRCQTGQYRR